MNCGRSLITSCTVLLAAVDMDVKIIKLNLLHDSHLFGAINGETQHRTVEVGVDAKGFERARHHAVSARCYRANCFRDHTRRG